MEDDFVEDTILLCSSPLPPAKSIYIEGSRGDGEKAGEPGCDTFRPDVATIRRYFSKARFINEQDWIHKLTWISCRGAFGEERSVLINLILFGIGVQLAGRREVGQE